MNGKRLLHMAENCGDLDAIGLLNAQGADLKVRTETTDT